MIRINAFLHSSLASSSPLYLFVYNSVISFPYHLSKDQRFEYGLVLMGPEKKRLILLSPTM